MSTGLTQDNTQPIEPFLKDFFSSLDLQYQGHPNVEAYATQFAKQLKQSSAVIINGAPLIPTTNNDSKLEFQKKWLSVPSSQHQLTSYDCHLIPGTGTFIINSSCKVRFDESGRNRLGESADLVQDPQSSVGRVERPIWGSWFGLNMNLVVDEMVLSNSSAEVINSLDYRITYKPEHTVIQL